MINEDTPPSEIIEFDGPVVIISLVEGQKSGSGKGGCPNEGCLGVSTKLFCEDDAAPSEASAFGRRREWVYAQYGRLVGPRESVS